MQKRYYLKSSTSSRRNTPCIICCQLQKSNSPSILLPSIILINKYKYPQQQHQQSSIITNLIASRPPSANLINYKYTLQQSIQSQSLTQYRSFQNVVALIKPLILERTNKDNKPLIHFQSHKAYQSTLNRYRQIRLMRRKKPQFKCILAKNGSGTSTDEQLYSSPLKIKKRSIIPDIKPPETEAVQRMTRNLSNMLRKYDQNQQFHPSQIFDLIDSVPGHVLDITQLEKQFQFKKELLNNFSVIQEQQLTARPLIANPSKYTKVQLTQRLNTGPVERLYTSPTERLQTVPCEIEDNHYGFKNRGNIALSRNLNNPNRQAFKKQASKTKRKWLKENQSPNIRVHTDYDYQFIKKEKKRSVNSKQLSKDASSSLKSIGRSKDKSKANGSRPKLQKKY